MGWHRSIRWLLRASWTLVLPGLLAASSSRAQADDDGEVIKRLTKYGKLSGGEAKRLERTVSGRLKRAADITNNSDPLRMAVSNALYGTPVPADQMAAAKVRLRLYAGLNEWALDQLFAPRPGAVATCTNNYGLSKSDCEALIAAGGRTSLGDAARLGSGTPVGGPAVSPQPQYGARPAYGQPAYGPQPAYGQPAYGQPRYGQAPAYGAQPSRFGASYNSGYQQRPVQNYGPAPAAAGYAPGYAAQRPVAAARPVPMAAPQPMAPRQSAAERKAEYARQRQAYLDRKKQEMEARKNKVVATAGGTERVQRGPTSAEEAAVAGIDPAEVPANKPAPAPAKGAAPGKPAKAAPVAAAPAADEPPAGPEKAPALENDFLDSLMDDPLGKSK
jgi:hypothetical protein